MIGLGPSSSEDMLNLSIFSMLVLGSVQTPFISAFCSTSAVKCVCKAKSSRDPEAFRLSSQLQVQVQEAVLKIS